MLQVKNATPFAADIALLANEQGVDTIYPLVKSTFQWQNNWILSEEQLPPATADTYHGEPMQSSILLASDFHTGKPSTDIVVIGEACVPNEKQTTCLDVEIQIEKMSKRLRVFGDRVWKDGQMTSPQPFSRMPIIYEKAFGGRHQINEKEYIEEPRNPIGCGFKGKRSSREMEGLSLPNIEDPQNLIQWPSDQPTPAGFGFCASSWMPRQQFAGTYDKQWQQERAPYLAVDFDSRFFNGAHPDLIYPTFLQGGERIQVRNMHPEGDMQFQLPEISLQSEVFLSQTSHKLPMTIDTLIVEPNKKQISMVWRSRFVCDKKALKVKQVTFKLLR